MNVAQVRVGDVLRLERRAVTVNPLETYKEIGVRSFGKGIFHKDPVSGIEIGTKRVFRIEPGDLVFSNVFAWEGAVALATDAERGFIGSHRFMTYVARFREAVSPLYLCYFFISEPGLQLLRRASPGSAGRNRTLAIDRFEDLVLPLPDIEEQRRIEHRLRTLLDPVTAVTRHLKLASILDETLVERAVDEIICTLVRHGWEEHPLADLAEVNPLPCARSMESSAFVAMSGVDDMTGVIKSFELRSSESVRSGYKQFCEGDVIFARITPCMQNGKVAVVRGLPTNVAYGSTEFHVIRPKNSVSVEWIHTVLRSRWLRNQAKAHFKGTAGQQRVPAAFLEQVCVPIPPTVDAQNEALQRIDALLDLQQRIRELRGRSKALSDACAVSTLNRAFAGLM